MTKSIFEEVFDIIPIISLVVDGNVRVQQFNRAASALFGKDPKLTLKQKTGDILHCVNAMSKKGGCGTSEFCDDCVIRNSVKKAVKGMQVYRESTVLQLLQEERVQTVHAVITASPFDYNGKKMVLLMIEDMSELLQLREIIPICAHCKKIRTDKALWKGVEDYFSLHVGADFTHSICPDCMAKIYPKK